MVGLKQLGEVLINRLLSHAAYIGINLETLGVDPK